jgi:folylpolyglutamate synthase/dihydropteroate synthase
VCAEWFKDTVKDKDDTTKRVLVFNCTHGRDGLRLLSSISDIHKVVQFDHAVFSTNVTFKKGYTAGEKTKRKKKKKDCLEKKSTDRERTGTKPDSHPKRPSPH